MCVFRVSSLFRGRVFVKYLVVLNEIPGLGLLTSAVSRISDLMSLNGPIHCWTKQETNRKVIFSAL